MAKQKSILNIRREEIEDLQKMWKDGSRAPYRLNMEEFISFSEKIKVTMKIIQTSENPRLIVLETWLIIDFTIRHLLTRGLELYRFESEETSFLPINTKDCINMLQNFVKDQASKPLDPTRYSIKIPGEFFKIINSDKDFFEKYLIYEEQYYKQMDPNYSPSLLINNDSKYRSVDEYWFGEVSKLNDKWYEAINKINKLRNYAAHSFDENKIYVPLGIKGKNKLDKLKKYCKETLHELIGIK